jgi:hypothetical protein
MDGAAIIAYFDRAGLQIHIASENVNDRNRGVGILVKPDHWLMQEAMHFPDVPALLSWWEETARSHFRTLQVIRYVIGECKYNPAARDWVEWEGGTPFEVEVARVFKIWEAYEIEPGWQETLVGDGRDSLKHASADFFVHLARYRLAAEKEDLNRKVARARHDVPTRVSPRL